MGSGKTSVAKNLGERLNLKVIEMDDLILKKSKRISITEIFLKDGEEHFRALETKIAGEISRLENVIVSTGGGVVMNKININKLRMNGKIIFLKTSFLEIKKRLKNINNRPLFKNRKKTKNLFVFRQKLYEEFADLIVNTDDKSVEKIAYEIISQN